MSRRRVVITGLGIVSPVGNDVATAWQNVVADESNIAPITHFDASGMPVRLPADQGLRHHRLSAGRARHFDTFIHYGIAAGVQALRDSGLAVTDANAERIGVVVGSGIGGLPLIEEQHGEYTNRGVRRISPFFVPGSIVNLISGQLSIMTGAKGPKISPSPRPAPPACTQSARPAG